MPASPGARLFCELAARQAAWRIAEEDRHALELAILEGMAFGIAESGGGMGGISGRHVGLVDHQHLVAILVDGLDVEAAGDEILVQASARSFLHHQVRAMVGSLRLVGDGRWRLADLAQALAARDRQAAGPNAPACGLYLVGVDYAPEVPVLT